MKLAETQRVWWIPPHEAEGEFAKSKNVVFPARRQSPVTRLRKKVLPRRNHSQAKSGVPAVTRGGTPPFTFRSHMHRLILNRHILVLPTQQVRFPFFQSGIAQSRIKGFFTGELFLAQELLLVSSDDIGSQSNNHRWRSIHSSFVPVFPNQDIQPIRDSLQKVASQQEWF